MAVLAVIAALAVTAIAVARQSSSARAAAVTITSQPFGTTTGGTPVQIFTLSNGHMRVRITNFGGVIQSIYVPDRHGRMADMSAKLKLPAEALTHLGRDRVWQQALAAGVAADAWL